MNRRSAVFCCLGLVLVCGVLVGFLLTFGPSIQAQTDCCNPPFDSTLPRFAPNSNVTVTISSAFTEAERQDIITAFQDWNVANATNGSNIVFSGFVVGESPVLAANNQFVGYDPNGKGVAAQNYVGRDGDSAYGRMYLSPAIRRPVDPNIRRAYTRGVSRHEIGHGFGLENASNCPSSSSTVMYSPPSTDSIITVCDNSAIETIYPTPTPTPTSTPTPDPIYVCPIDDEYSCYNQGTGWMWDPNSCFCRPVRGEIGGGCDANPEDCSNSPILVDISGNGFELTSPTNGVLFDLNSDGSRERLSWTPSNSDDAWLALDRNGNGLIDNGRELFGNHTAQPMSDIPNGFIALAVFDQVDHGGNGDGWIDGLDAVFGRLRLWLDANHNGVSESGEFYSLQSLGLSRIDLDYKESRKVDAFGNRFKYRSKVVDAHGYQLGRWAWDVFLVNQP